MRQNVSRIGDFDDPGGDLLFCGGVQCTLSAFGTARRQPAIGELFVLTDGAGVVVNRLETMRETDPVGLRLLSANPDYALYTCLAEEARIIGKVLWTDLSPLNWSAGIVRERRIRYGNQTTPA